MKLSQAQIQHYTNQFKACGTKITSVKPFHGVWYNGYNFKFIFDINVPRKANESWWSATHKRSEKMRDIVDQFADKEYDYRTRREYMLSVFTSEEQMLQDILTGNFGCKFSVEHTSDDYLEGLLQIEGVPTDVKIVKRYDPNKKYKIHFKYLRTKDKNVCHALLTYLQNNQEFFTPTSDTLYRRLEKNVLWGDEYIYCNDQDAVMMLHIVAPSIIKKVYQQMEKNKNAE